jgi:hypothetical protein
MLCARLLHLAPKTLEYDYGRMGLWAYDYIWLRRRWSMIMGLWPYDYIWLRSRWSIIIFLIGSTVNALIKQMLNGHNSSSSALLS